VQATIFKHLGIGRAADRGQHREVAGVSPKLAHGKRLPRHW
jgi:hypothetical protein